jgi:hypothetical protein
MAACHLCGKTINPDTPHHIVSILRAEGEGTARKILGSEEVALVCDECRQEGLAYVFLNLRHLHGADTRLMEKMETIKKSLSLVEILKEFGISGEPAGTSNLFLARCPFHQQESSFLYDDQEYYCFCEGLKGDIFSFIMNYYRDVERQEMTLKKAVDFLLAKVPA